MRIFSMDPDGFSDRLRDTPFLLILFSSRENHLCRQTEELLAEVAAAYPGLPAETVCVEETPVLAKAYVIRVLPTLLLFRNGELLCRWTGELSATEILPGLQNILQVPGPADADTGKIPLPAPTVLPFGAVLPASDRYSGMAHLHREAGFGILAESGPADSLYASLSSPRELW